MHCKEPLSVPELQWALSKHLTETPDLVGLDVIHPRCAVLNRTHESDPTRTISQSEYDYLNLIRLSVTPNIELSTVTNENNAWLYSSKLVANMDFEQKSLHLKMLEACRAQVEVAIAQDPLRRKAYLEERERERFSTSTAKTSKATSGPKLGSKELQLKTFMELHGLTEMVSAEKILNTRNKAVTALMQVGFTEQDAIAACDRDLLKQGKLKK